MVTKSSRSNRVDCRIFVVSHHDDSDRWCQWIEEDFRGHNILARSLAEAHVVVVIVGRHFIRSFAQKRGIPRRKMIKVHELIRQAFKTQKRIIPILVDGASIPDTHSLPSDIQPLSLQNALSVRSKENLSSVLAHVIAAAYMEASQQEQTNSKSKVSVFISYRRNDSSYWAGDLARSLATKLGFKAVYLDIGSGLPGQDFRKQINNMLSKSTDVAVVIGAGFLERNQKGVRRIDLPDDMVRYEIRLALSLQKRIHVVLIGTADMPKREQLPDTIAELANTKSVFRVRSRSDATYVADRIVNQAKVFDAGENRLPLRSSVEFRRSNSTVDDTLTTSFVASLLDYGWNIQNSGARDVLANSRFPEYRLRLHRNPTEILLEERTTNMASLGFGKWVLRSVFPVSPHALDDRDMLRLPDNLLEAALDPARFLARTGRIDLNKAAQPPMRPGEFSSLLRSHREPNAHALEAYLRLQRKGSPKQLVLEGHLKLPDKGNALVVASYLTGNGLAVATDKGVVQFLGRERISSVLIDNGIYESIDISSRGMLAIGTCKGELSIWNSKNSMIVDSATPYSWWRIWQSKRQLKTLAWSPNGNVLAFSSQNEVWIYTLSSKKFSKWAYPVDPRWKKSEIPNNGVQFSPNGRELVVFAYSTFLWVVEIETGNIRSRIELPARPRGSLIRSLVHREPDPGPKFYDIYDVDFNPQGNLLACASSDGQIVLYDFKSMRQQQVIVGHEPFTNGLPSDVDCILFSPNGRWMASIGGDDRLIVWDTAIWEPIRSTNVSWTERRAGRRVITWSADSTRIVACGAESSLTIWRL